MKFLEYKDINKELAKLKEVNDSYYGKSIIWNIKENRRQTILSFSILFNSKIQMQIMIEKLINFYQNKNTYFFLKPMFLSFKENELIVFVEYYLNKGLYHKIMRQKAKEKPMSLKLLHKINNFWIQALKFLHQKNFCYFNFHFDNLQILEEEQMKIKFFPYFYRHEIEVSQKNTYSIKIFQNLQWSKSIFGNIKFLKFDCLLDYETLYLMMIRILDIESLLDFYINKGKNQYEQNIEHLRNLEAVNIKLNERKIEKFDPDYNRVLYNNWKFWQYMLHQDATIEKVRRTTSIKKSQSVTQKILQKIEKLIRKKNSEPFKYFRKRGLYLGENSDDYEYQIGTMDFFNGDFYCGVFKNDSFEKQGLYLFQNSEYYYGGFKYHKFSGYGEYYYKNGDVYKGFFQDGKKNGKGIYFNKKKKIIFKGTFENDQKTGIFQIYDVQDNISLQVTFENDSIKQNLQNYLINDVLLSTFIQELQDSTLLKNMRSMFDYLEYFVNESVLKKDFILERDCMNLKSKVVVL